MGKYKFTAELECDNEKVMRALAELIEDRIKVAFAVASVEVGESATLNCARSWCELIDKAKETDQIDS